MRLQTLLLSIYKLYHKILGRKTVHFIHIGKTAGSAIRSAFEKESSLSGNFIPQWRKFFIMHGHEFKFKDVKFDELAFFVVRDPIDRFVSGFYSRKRMGMPKNHNPWSEAERVAFEKFETADELASSLSSPEEKLRLFAEAAMKGIGHVNTSYWNWFNNSQYLIENIHKVIAVLRQEYLSEDFENFKRAYRLTVTELPLDDTKSHRNPDKFNKMLSEQSRENLKKWYREDYKFLDFLYELKLIPTRYEI